MKITENTKLNDLRHIPEIGKNYIYVSFSTGLFRPIFNGMTIKKLAPAGGPADMLKGLDRLVEVAKQKNPDRDYKELEEALRITR